MARPNRSPPVSTVQAAASRPIARTSDSQVNKDGASGLRRTVPPSTSLETETGLTASTD